MNGLIFQSLGLLTIFVGIVFGQETNDPKNDKGSSFECRQEVEMLKYNVEAVEHQLDDFKGEKQKEDILDDKTQKYFIGFLKNYEDKISNELRQLLISTNKRTKVRIQIQQSHYDKVVNLEANGHTRINDIPIKVSVTGNDTVTKEGVLVTATEQIWIQGGNAQDGSVDGFNAVKIDKYAVDFIVASYNTTSREGSGFVVVGTEDNTLVSTFRPTSSGKRVLVAHHLINAMDTYSWYEPKGLEVTGFRIQSNKPIAVFSGNQCANVPIGVSYCDHLVSSMPPIANLGMEYIVPPIAGRPGYVGYQLKVVATESDTVIKVYRHNILHSSVLKEGQFQEWNITPSDEAINVACSKVCLVLQFNKGCTAETNPDDRTRTDPFMLTMISNAAQTREIRFATLDHYKETVIDPFRKNYLIIICPDDVKSYLYLDDEVITRSWSSVPGWTFDLFVYTTVSVTNGFHHLKVIGDVKGGFIAYVEGMDAKEYERVAYGYRAGLY